jgi:hypothetical protein
MKDPMVCSWKIFADAGVCGVRITGLKLVSEANQREHYMAKYKRNKVQQAVTLLALRGLDPVGMLGQELVITLTRIAPRALDSDNLAGSFKHTQDAIAKHIRIDDGDRRLEWRYQQAKGKYGVEVRMERKQRGAA